MADYTELVKSLRESAANKRLMTYAADAIMELEAAVNKLLHITNDLETEVDHLERERRWIPVEERLPEKNDDVLIYGKRIGRSGTEYRETWLTSISELEYQGYTPIAWMPLPEPPKEDV